MRSRTIVDAEVREFYRCADHQGTDTGPVPIPDCESAGEGKGCLKHHGTTHHPRTVGANQESRNRRYDWNRERNKRKSTIQVDERR